MNNDMKVIGVFACKGMNVACIDTDSCVIIGSKEKMEEYLKESEELELSIKKTKYGEIKKGLEMKAAYSFDEESYKRFYPLGKADGMQLKEWEEVVGKEKGFITLR